MIQETFKKVSVFIFANFYRKNDFHKYCLGCQEIIILWVLLLYFDILTFRYMVFQLGFQDGRFIHGLLEN